MKSTTLPPFVSRRAFTLVEILAVIVIIGVLVAILIPVVSSIRRKTFQTRCNGNLRQVASAYLMWMYDDKQHRLIRYYQYIDISEPGDWQANPYMFTGNDYCGLGLYLGAPRAHLYPPVAFTPVALADEEFVAKNQDPNFPGYFRGTSYMPNITAWNKYWRLADIPSPARLGMAAPVSIECTRNNGYSTAAYLWPWETTLDRFEDYKTGNTCLAFFDGHIKTVPRTPQSMLTYWDANSVP
jgi:prepilin-type N-terminal cleavage/methylation domain-containing protein